MQMKGKSKQAADLRRIVSIRRESLAELRASACCTSAHLLLNACSMFCHIMDGDESKSFSRRNFQRRVSRSFARYYFHGRGFFFIQPFEYSRTDDWILVLLGHVRGFVPSFSL